MNDEQKTKPQFAPPPQGAEREPVYEHGARIPCTRSGTEGTDASAAAVWAFALGRAIGAHGGH